jgi:hypothetical protein
MVQSVPFNFNNLGAKCKFTVRRLLKQKNGKSKLYDWPWAYDNFWLLKWDCYTVTLIICCLPFRDPQCNRAVWLSVTRTVILSAILIQYTVPLAVEFLWYRYGRIRLPYGPSSKPMRLQISFWQVSKIAEWTGSLAQSATLVQDTNYTSWLSLRSATQALQNHQMKPK